jgi:hypothetical protein
MLDIGVRAGARLWISVAIRPVITYIAMEVSNRVL